MKRPTKAPIYRIAKWKETFEKSDARRLKSLPWISVPTDLGSNGYMAMVEEFDDEAPAIYGAWIALCAFAAGCDERGVLATSKGDAIPLARVAKRTGFPVSVFDKLIAWASNAEVAWIESLSPSGASRKKSEEVSEVPREDSDLPRKPPGELTDYGQDGHYEQDKTDGRTDGETAFSEPEPQPPETPARPPARYVSLDESWEEVRDHAMAIHGQVDPDRRPLSKIDRKHCVQFAALQVGYPELASHFADIAERVGVRVRRGPSLDRPWAWVRSELIRVCNEFGPGFDAMIVNLDMRRTVRTPEGEGLGDSGEFEGNAKAASAGQAANAPP